jgi:hypothetical protein
VIIEEVTKSIQEQEELEEDTEEDEGSGSDLYASE